MSLTQTLANHLVRPKTSDRHLTFSNLFWGVPFESSSIQALNTEVRSGSFETTVLRRDNSSNNAPFVSTVGVLACLDGYMNIAMEQTEEFVDGQLKAKYGDCFIRGNNGEFVVCESYHIFARRRGRRLMCFLSCSVVHFNAKENVK